MKNTEMDNTPEDDGNEIDLMAIIKKFKDKKRFIIICCIIGLIAGIVVVVSIPKEYTTTVILAQSSPEKSSGSLGALASFAGVDLQQNSSGELSPVLYPDILASTPFLLGLFDIHVVDAENEINTSLGEYLSMHQKTKWWNDLLALPFRLFASSSKPVADNEGSATSNSKILILSPLQQGIVGNLKSRINISLDKKTGCQSISVTMQSPIISAIIADTVISYMQSYIINYRMEKARQNLEYVEKLYHESKDDYFTAQQIYAKATDENHAVISARHQTHLTRLMHEMTLAYNIYNQTAQQLQLAKIKLEDTKPICVIIQPAVVPSIPSKPNKKIIIAGFLFMAFAGACGWVFLKDMLSGKKEEEEVNT